jgi:hypothetical protein
MIVNTLNQLKKLAVDGADFYIALNFGLKSSKTITYIPGNNTFEIFNDIDGSFDILTEEELFNQTYTNVGYALENNALFAYEYENA